MKEWLFLIGAIVFETFATSMLKLSEQFTRPLPTIAMLAGYILSFYLLSHALRTVPIGIAYAIWSALGIVLITLIGIFVFKQVPDIPAYIRLNVEIDNFLPLEAQTEASQLTEGKQCRFCCINARRKAAQQTEAKMLSVQEFQAEEPVEIAKRFAEDTGIDFDSEMQDMFRELMTMVNEDARNEERRTKE